MSAAEEEFHTGEVTYEQATRKLVEAAALFGLAATYFADAGGALGRGRSVEAYNQCGSVSDTITAAKLTIAESQGYYEETG